MKKLTKGILFVVMCSLLGDLYALDREKLADHLRKTLNESTETKFIVGDPSDSEFKGLKKVPVSIQTTRGTQDTVIYFSNKEKKYILGNVLDLTVDPDEERASHISIKGAPFKGRKDAPVKIIEFSDLQCVYCRKAHLTLEKELFKAYSPKQVEWVYKHFPLGGHDWSRAAGIAAVCAQAQGNDKFWKMAGKFFGQQEKINKQNIDSKVNAFASQLGLDQKKFEACLSDPETEKKLQTDREQGLKAGVRSTPSFFVNGRLIRGFNDIDRLKPYIDEKLKSAN